MGNCLFGAMGDGDGQLPIRVATSNGGVMELGGPTTVESITDQFPGHGIFRAHDLFWKPLPHTDILLAGESYHLLPLSANGGGCDKIGHVRSSSAPPCQMSGSVAAPYRMSVDSRGWAGKRTTSPTPPDDGAACGFWKVKLVISPGQLMEILAEDGRTEELIESVRTVAKCGSGGMGGFSDQWSLTSSRNAASSNKDSSLFEF